MTPFARPEGPGSRRLYVAPDTTIEFTDRRFGRQRVDLAVECGDFIVRRADGPGPISWQWWSTMP